MEHDEYVADRRESTSAEEFRPSPLAKILVGVFVVVLGSSALGLASWRYDYGQFRTEFLAFKDDGPRYSLDTHTRYVAPVIDKNSRDIERLESEILILSRTVREYQAKTMAETNEWRRRVDEHLRSTNARKHGD